MREMKDYGSDGLCPIEDESPLLSEENEIISSLFDQAMATANSVSGADKDFYYVKPADVESLMNMHEIDSDDKPEVMRRIIILQNISNEQRPNRPKRKG